MFSARLRTVGLGSASAAAAAAACGLSSRASCEKAAAGDGGRPPSSTKKVVDDVVSRLGGLLFLLSSSSEGLEERPANRGVKIFALTEDRLAEHTKKQGGLPVVRVAETTVKVPIDDVARLWWNAGSRKRWDSINTEDSSVVASLGKDRRLVYLQGKPKRGGVIASRDFSYEMCRLEDGDAMARAGGHPGSALFVQLNRAEDLPSRAPSVRGDVNSILLLNQVDGGLHTKLLYAVEVDVRGWLPTSVVKKAADDLPMVLAEMRDHLEGQAAAQAGMSDDEIAKLHVAEDSESSPSSSSSLSRPGATRDEILAAKSVLERQLKNLADEERKAGMKFDDLKAQIREQIREINKRL